MRQEIRQIFLEQDQLLAPFQNGENGANMDRAKK